MLVSCLIGCFLYSESHWLERHVSLTVLFGSDKRFARCGRLISPISKACSGASCQQEKWVADVSKIASEFEQQYV